MVECVTVTFFILQFFVIHTSYRPRWRKWGFSSSVDRSQWMRVKHSIWLSTALFRRRHRYAWRHWEREREREGERTDQKTGLGRVSTMHVLDPTSLGRFGSIKNIYIYSVPEKSAIWFSKNDDSAQEMYVCLMGMAWSLTTGSWRNVSLSYIIINLPSAQEDMSSDAE